MCMMKLLESRKFLSWMAKQLQITIKRNIFCLMHVKTKTKNVHGNPLQSSSIGVDIFFSLMRSYFWRLVAALRPCQGKLPRRKYINT